jgi:putative transcriptional regulator
MTTNNKKTSRLAEALLETAKDMRETGILGEAAYEKITMRHLGTHDQPVMEPLTGEEIRMMREQAHMSQSVFARYLNVRLLNELSG